MAEHFLTKTRVFREDCLPVGAALAVECYGELLTELSHRVGPDVASIFAEPFISKSSDDGQLTVAWYTDLSGRGERLTDLSPEQAARIEARLTSLTRPLVHLAEDEDIGPLVRAALSIGSRADIWVIDDRPILVNWGMKTGAGQGDATLAGLIAPPRAASPSVASPVPEPRLVATAKSASAPVAGAAPFAAPIATTPRIAWVPLVVLLALATAALLWLLLPTTRVFFDYADKTAGAPAKVDADAAQEATLLALLDRKRLLNEALAGAQCRADGVLELPGGRSLDGKVLPPVGAGKSTADGADEAEPLLPLPPRRLAVGDAGAAQTLLDRLEGGTVLVLAGSAGSLSTGTGFSIGNGLIVSNAHVVEFAQAGGQVFVVHKSFVQPMPARIIKVSAPFEESGTDFVLLEVSNKGLPALPLMTNTQSRKLTPVIAAGFPADVMETDSAFAALIQGEVTAVPDLSVSDGIVTSEQQLPEGQTRFVFHTAPLSKGNSGGPLVDYCGSVVGVNTFVRRTELRNLNIALSTDDLVAFLADTPAAGIAVQDQSCRPTVIDPTSPVAPPTEPANPDTAVDGAGDAPTDQGGE